MNKMRHFNMTLAELIDKLTIDQIKEALLPKGQAKNYASEIERLEHDIDLVINEKGIKLSVEFISMLMLLAQANLHIWYIKDKMMDKPDNYIELLKFAQELNGIRNHIKNLILQELGEATPAAKRATFLNHKCNEWYTQILKTLNNTDKSKMETLKLTLDNFACLFQTEVDDFPHQCKAIVEERDFRYRKMAQEEREGLIANILKRIDSGELSVSGLHRQADWEQGWTENLKEYERTRNPYALTPKFITPNQAIRLDRDYIVPYSESFEFDFVDVLRRWLFDKYFKDKDAIYEFGCGSCQHLVVLAEMFPAKKIIGLDWASSSVEIINKLVEINGCNIEGRLFNLFEPDKGLKLKDNSAVFTVGTMEQLGCNYEPFLQYLLSNSVSLCLHLETIRELYDDNYLLDYLAIEFDSARGYLNGFLTRLRELEKEGRVEILKAQRIFFGSLYHDGYSLLMWRPRQYEN